MLLSGLLSRYLATSNEKVLDLLRRISPAAWQHLHFLGHDAFRDKRKPIDLEAILAGIDWEWPLILANGTYSAGFGLQPQLRKATSLKFIYHTLYKRNKNENR